MSALSLTLIHPSEFCPIRMSVCRHIPLPLLGTSSCKASHSPPHTSSPRFLGEIGPTVLPDMLSPSSMPSEPLEMSSPPDALPSDSSSLDSVIANTSSSTERPPPREKAGAARLCAPPPARERRRRIKVEPPEQHDGLSSNFLSDLTTTDLETYSLDAHLQPDTESGHSARKRTPRADIARRHDLGPLRITPEERRSATVCCILL
jgi:hypothetical protein